jgi:hypothetical protein
MSKSDRGGLYEAYAGYTVGLLRDSAFTIFYDDDSGRLTFVFEVTQGEQKKMYLNPRPSQDGRMLDVQNPATAARIELAISRVKTHFERTWDSVEIDR